MRNPTNPWWIAPFLLTYTYAKHFFSFENKNKNTVKLWNVFGIPVNAPAAGIHRLAPAFAVTNTKQWIFFRQYVAGTVHGGPS